MKSKANYGLLVIGSPIATTVPQLVLGENLPVWGAGTDGKSHRPLNFCCEAETSQNSKTINLLLKTSPTFLGGRRRKITSSRSAWAT